MSSTTSTPPPPATKRPGPLYSLALPPTLLSDLQPRTLHIPESHPLYKLQQSQLSSFSSSRVTKASATPPLPPPSAIPSHLAVEGVFKCPLTGATFHDLPSLREHYRTDWYLYNAKMQREGKPYPVSEEEFNTLVESLSLSGSDSSSNSSSDSDSDPSPTAVSRLLAKQSLAPSKSRHDPQDEEDTITGLDGPRSSLVWFDAPSHSPGTQFGVYRAILPVQGAIKHRSPQSGAAELEELSKIQLGEGWEKAGGGPVAGKKRQWTLLMFGGGHFAGMVVSLVPRLVSAGKGKEKEREVVVLQQKTFHRYTTRRGQGGSQSAHDSGGKGKARSAGAQIRRHNETALHDARLPLPEVQELLASWKEEIQDSELVFLRASKSNHKTFFDFEGCPFERRDPRIRGYSFPTKRPTINELLRAFSELTRVKTSHLTPEALAALDATYLASITPTPAPPPAAPKPSVPKPPTAPKLSKTEELERDRWIRAVDMVKKGKVDVLNSFLDKYGPELESGVEGGGGAWEGGVWGRLPGWMEEVTGKGWPTLLHVASANDQSEMVRWLLVEKRADPTLDASVLPPTSSSTTTSSTALTPTLTGTVGDGSTATLSTPNNPTTTTTTTTPTRPVLTPYELAPSRATRNVFRLLVTQHPDWWDWTGTGPNGARVPSGLDEAKEEERDAKARDRRAKLRDQVKAREREREVRDQVEREEKERVERERKEREEKELMRKKGNAVMPGGAQRLGGGAPRRIVESQMNAAGLTAEQRMRVEREQRARAAEARFAAGKATGGQ